MAPHTHLDRRSYLQTAGAAGLALAAGCTGLGSSDDYDHVVLDKPDQYEMFREARDNGDIDYPIHGDELPDVAAPCTIRGQEIATSDFEGERHSLYTFIFSRCHGACPGLTSALRHVQDDSVDHGYEDDVALLNVTFDPEYDTADVLEEYGRKYGADYDLDNWYFLRPETEADAQEYVEEEFGCFFERNPDYDGDGHDDNGHDDDGHDGDGHDDSGHDGDGGDDSGHDGDGGDDNGHDDNGHDGDGDEMAMAWQHESMIVLANADGYVERTYVGEVPTPNRVIDDVQTLQERW